MRLMAHVNRHKEDELHLGDENQRRHLQTAGITCSDVPKRALMSNRDWRKPSKGVGIPPGTRSLLHLS